MSAITFPSTIPAVSGEEKPHSIGSSLILHILPGIFILVLFVTSAPWVMRAGFPPLFAVTVIGASSGMVFQLWHLLNEGRKRNGKWSLEGIVLYWKAMPIWQYAVLIPLFIVLAFLIDGLTGPLKVALLNAIPWPPEWFEMRNPNQLLAYAQPVLILSFTLHLLINGIAAPIIEELYFRGYLMLRLSRFGRWTPVVETTLFTLYHFWQPYYWITQFLFMLPVVCVVYWKQNIRLGIAFHVAVNMLGGLLLMGLVFG